MSLRLRHVRSAPSTSRVAAVLLLILFNHLIFMASPLHAISLGAHGIEFTADEANHGHGSSGSAPIENHPDETDDCEVTSAPPARPLLAMVSHLGHPNLARFAANSIATCAPLPQTHGPPQQVDIQALLQVFLN